MEKGEQHHGPPVHPKALVGVGVGVQAGRAPVGRATAAAAAAATATAAAAAAVRLRRLLRPLRSRLRLVIVGGA